MSQFPLSPVPYQIRMSGDMMVKASENHHHAYNFLDKENISPSNGIKKIAFPSTKAVLWNRNPIGPPAKLGVLENPSSVKLLLNERILQLAYKQLHVAGEDFNGFCIGELQIQDSKMSIILDRFDPGRDGHINTECGTQKVRIPTTSIPGDLNIPIHLCTGMAFVDHVTTQTHTEEEFVKTMKVLESWCSRKDALDVNNLFSLKIKCCFQDNNDEILTYITCGMLYINEEFSLVPINPIPIIPTALARNLEGPVSLSDVQGHVKTGFITMDQTRKLLLLLETDPKAYSLPLVGVWVSGVRDIDSPEVWACCTRFIHNRNIEEKVYAPPSNYLLLVYATKSVSVIFHEFSSTDNKYNNVNFQFLCSCEGIAMSKANSQSVDEEYTFDLVNMSTGALVSTFQKAENKYNGYVEEMHDTKKHELPTTSSHDDSIPLDCPTHLPLPQIQMGVHQSFPSVPDLSMCESSVVDPTVCDNIINTNNCVPRKVKSVPSKTAGGSKLVEAAVTKSMQASKMFSNKHPRQTKASLARMDINKQVRYTNASKNCQKKANLAISFNNPKKKEKEAEKDVEQITINDVNIIDTVDKIEQDKEILKLPVKIRQRSELLQSLNSSYVIEESHNKIKESGEITDNDAMLENLQPQPYCPAYYSDASAEESFIFNSNKDDIDSPEELGATYQNLQVEKYEVYDCKREELDIKDVVEDINMQPSVSAAPLKNMLHETMETDVDDDKDGDNVELEIVAHKDVDISKRTKDDLYDLVLTQQEQLANLQAQLEIFLKHQNIKQDEKKLDEERKEIEKGRSESVVSSELSSVQEMQRIQLNALQLQVQEFLESSKSPDKKDTSSQCSIVYCPEVVPRTFNSIAVNTGESLFWPTRSNTPSTNSDTTPCGCRQDERVGGKSRNVDRRESFCHHCHRAKKSKERSKKLDNSIISNGYSGIVQVSSPSLSDICTEDIASSIFEDTANSSLSISSSLKEVDMPVYDESQDAFSSPVLQTKNKRDWNSSPVLGESASMLSEEGQKDGVEDPSENLKKEESEDINEPINNEEFYEQVMCQVQKLIEAQNISISSTNSNDNIYTDVDNEAQREDVTTSPEEDLQRVREVTVKQLNEIINQPYESESVSPNLLTERNECTPTGIIATLPRINYMSMAVDETMNEESSFNRLAAKYLPNKYLQDEMTETCNKTVKFQGVCELNTAGKNINMASVNFSCNMSIATKKYLQRYELIDGEKIPTQPLIEVNGRVLRKVKHSSSSYSESDKENILDFKKLRGLPKLL